MQALSIRQPYPELIPSTGSGLALRGIKPIEFWFDKLTADRSRPTRKTSKWLPDDWKQRNPSPTEQRSGVCIVHWERPKVTSVILKISPPLSSPASTTPSPEMPSLFTA